MILHAPVAPVVQTVNIGALMDTGKNQDIPLIHDDVFNIGIENWRRIAGHGLDDPDPSIRPSLQQYTAWLGVVNMGSIYVDFSLCAPWDIRTQRSRRWKGLVLGADGRWHEEECRGPPNFECWELCFRLWECMGIMSETILPPRFTAYFNMVKTLSDKHAGPGLFAFWYQQEDRYRHEQFPDMLRLQNRQYNQAVTEYSTSGWWTPITEQGSTFNPDAPWNHILLLAVRSAEARQWWTDSFKDEAIKVLLKIKNVSTLIEGDAPIAASVSEHASTPYVPHQPHKGGGGKVRPEAPWKAPKGQTPPAHRPPPAGAPKRRKTDITDKFQICHGYSNGHCNEVASGPCGPNSCSKKSQFIHACFVCGEVGHSGKTCTATAPPAKRARGNRQQENRKGRGKGDATRR